MVDQIIGSGVPGSPNVPSTTAGQAAPGGQTNASGANDRNYDELYSRFGSQGQELGEYKSFFKSIEPLLTQLDKNPELVQAITDGKLSGELAKAVLEGRVDIRDAAAVQVAHDRVKEQMGAAAYANAKSEDIQKMVTRAVGEFRKEFEDKAEMGSFESYTNNFIESKPDFEEYAGQIDEWLDENDVTDIAVAYYAVKGQLSEAQAKKAAEKDAANSARDMFTGVSNPGITSQYAADGTPMVDKLIAGRPNPNSFFPGA